MQPNQSIASWHGNRAVTTSLTVASHFGKKHQHVLQAIRQLLDDCPDPLFAEAHFQLTNYVNSQGKRQPMYELTRDGFSLLAMGFTGAEALRWKIAFINAFNTLERGALADPLLRRIEAMRLRAPELPEDLAIYAKHYLNGPLSILETMLNELDAAFANHTIPASPRFNGRGRRY